VQLSDIHAGALMSEERMRRIAAAAAALDADIVVLTGEVWASYLILGGIFVLAGAFVWTLRSPRNEDANA